MTASGAPSFDGEVALKALRLFLGWCDPNLNVEIIHGSDGPNKALLFPISNLEDAVAFARQCNECGENIYFGVHPRKANVNIGKRASADGVECARFAFVDCDTAMSVERLTAWCQNEDLPAPMAYVRTGTTPSLRWHAYWQLDDELRNFEAARTIQKALADAIGSDDAVIDTARIMRLPGSVSYPSKDKQSRGYIVETVGFSINEDADEVNHEAILIAARSQAPEPAPQQTGNFTSLNIGSQSQWHLVERDDLVAKIMRGENWHINVNRFVGSRINRGDSDTEIHMMTDQFTLAGYTVEQTRAEVQPMIDSARAKGFGVVRSDGSAINHNVIGMDGQPVAAPQNGLYNPNPTPQAREPVELAFKLDDFKVSGPVFANDPGPINWLIEGTIPLGVPGMVAAMGGVGKSYMLLELGMRVASGLPSFESATKIFGGQVVETGNVVILSAEDGADEINRRLRSLDPTRHRWSDRLRVVPLLSAGGKLKILSQTHEGTRATPEYYALLDQLKQIDDLKLVVIDPLQTFVNADIQSQNQAAQDLSNLVAQIAEETGATTLAAHHMRKTNAEITTITEARDAIRGVTGLLDGLRVVYALWSVGDHEARTIWDELHTDALGIAPPRYDTGSIARGAVVKENFGADKTIALYARDRTGLLVDRTQTHLRKRTPQGDLDALLVECIRRAAADGYPFTKTGQAGLFERRSLFPAVINGERRQWYWDRFDRLVKQKKLVTVGKSQNFLDVPGGPFAAGEVERMEGAYAPDWSDLERMHSK